MRQYYSDIYKHRHRSDEIRHAIRKFESVFEILILMLTYYIIWKLNYREISSMPTYYGNGKFILVGVYAILVIVIFYLCDSFKFGHLKFGDVLVSQWFSLLIVNAVTYFQLCLIANHMLNVVPMLILFIIDLVISFILVYFFTAFYHKHFGPRDIVMIYGNKNAVNLKFKMDARRDKYRITNLIDINSAPSEIWEEIIKHDAVIINDVPAQIRNDILKFCYEREIRTYIVPKITDIIARGAEDITLFDTPLLLVKGRGLTLEQRFVKRLMDIIISLIALVPCIPIMLIIAVAIKIEDRGPIFYKQKRLTIGGREFNILKFRSMTVDAEKGGYNLHMRANDNDSRITKVGKVIRACRIDELPQILNILKGDMSIVGPRPERLENTQEYAETIPEFAYRTKVKGGLTGYAQIYGKYNTSPYDKVRLDLMYIENYSLFLDIKLLFMTLQILVKRESTEGFNKVEELEKQRDKLLQEQSDMLNEVAATVEDDEK